MADRARRVHARPDRRAGRAVDAPFPGGRGPRQRAREGRPPLRAAPAVSRQAALRCSPDPRAGLLGGDRVVTAMRVLIVEDDERLAEIFRDFIGELGYQPTVVGSAELALEALTTTRPDTILLDVRLPGMSGVEFLSLAPVRDSEVPVIVVSGVATEVEARACLKLGALDFIRKPVTLERLGQVLAYLKPFAMSRQQIGQRQIERRPAPRAAVKLGVRITASNGAFDGTSIELSSSGMKARVDQRLRPGQAAKLEFTPPDGGAPIDVLALVVRVDPDSAAFWFLDLMTHDADRLNALVDRLQH